jgi:hypothetical protein
MLHAQQQQQQQLAHAEVNSQLMLLQQQLAELEGHLGVVDQQQQLQIKLATLQQQFRQLLTESVCLQQDVQQQVLLARGLVSSGVNPAVIGQYGVGLGTGASGLPGLSGVPAAVPVLVAPGGAGLLPLVMPAAAAGTPVQMQAGLVQLLGYRPLQTARSLHPTGGAVQQTAALRAALGAHTGNSLQVQPSLVQQISNSSSSGSNGLARGGGGDKDCIGRCHSLSHSDASTARATSAAAAATAAAAAISITGTAPMLPPPQQQQQQQLLQPTQQDWESVLLDDELGLENISANCQSCPMVLTGTGAQMSAQQGSFLQLHPPDVVNLFNSSIQGMHNASLAGSEGGNWRRTSELQQPGPGQLLRARSGPGALGLSAGQVPNDPLQQQQQQQQHQQQQVLDTGAAAAAAFASSFDAVSIQMPAMQAQANGHDQLADFAGTAWGAK